MTAEKRKPRVGDERWEVEWCSKLAFYEDSEYVDHDACEMSVRYFPTREAALTFAAKIWPTTADKLGIVSISPQRYEAYDDGDGSGPYLPHWETCGEPEILSDDSGQPE